jgi:hypothetical protein
VAVLIAVSSVASALAACSSNSSTEASVPPASSPPVATSSAWRAPSTFVGTWQSAEGNVLVVGKAAPGYVAALYTDGQTSPLKSPMRRLGASLVSSGTSSVFSWKLSCDTGSGRLVLRDTSRGMLTFTRVSSSTASPSAQ